MAGKHDGCGSAAADGERRGHEHVDEDMGTAASDDSHVHHDLDRDGDEHALAFRSSAYELVECACSFCLRTSGRCRADAAFKLRGGPDIVKLCFFRGDILLEQRADTIIELGSANATIFELGDPSATVFQLGSAAAGVFQLGRSFRLRSSGHRGANFLVQLGAGSRIV